LKNLLAKLFIVSTFVMMLLIDVHAKNTSVNEDYIKSPKGNIYIRTEGSGHPVVIINGGPGAGHTIFLGWFDFL